MRWIKQEATGKQVYIYILIFLETELLYSLVAVNVFHLFKIDIPSVRGSGGISMLNLYFLFMLIVGALIEEVIFRLPLATAVKMKWELWKVLVAAAALSIAFGALHGSIHHIFIQGVTGFMFSILFLKCGGSQGKYLKGITAAAANHFLFNGTLALFAVAGGAIKF